MTTKTTRGIVLAIAFVSLSISTSVGLAVEEAETPTEESTSPQASTPTEPVEQDAQPDQSVMEQDFSPSVDSAAHAMPLGEPADAIRSDIDSIGMVTGSPTGKVLLSVGDVISVRLDESVQPQPRGIMTVVRPGHGVRHPQSGEWMGQLVKVVGTIELYQAVGRFWSAKVVRSPDFMTPGDLIVPSEIDGGPTGTESPAPGESGFVVAVPNREELVGAFQLVYTDLGSDHGARPGQMFSIIREAARGRDASPPRKIGEVKIVALQPASSSALVTASEEPIEIGDRIEPLSP